MRDTTTLHTRQANLELLRIFSMLLIVVWHMNGHIIQGSPIVHPLVTGMFDKAQILISFHVDLFILITGYFGIRHSTRGFVKTLSLCLFYLIGINMVSLLRGNGINWLEIIFPISNMPWWFMRNYLILTLIAPFIEIMLNSCTKVQQNQFAVLLLLLDIYFAHVWHFSFYHIGYGMLNFITIYVLGKWIRNNNLSHLVQSIVNRCKMGGVKRILYFGLFYLYFVRQHLYIAN